MTWIYNVTCHGTQAEHNNTMPSDVVNPGPESGTQTEHNNTMTSDVVNPGPGLGQAHKLVPDPGPGFTTSLVMVLLCSVCVPDPGPGFTTSLVMVLLCSVCVPDPGPGFTMSTN
jgi:hypothetical protein